MVSKASHFLHVIALMNRIIMCIKHTSNFCFLSLFEPIVALLCLHETLFVCKLSYPEIWTYFKSGKHFGNITLVNTHVHNIIAQSTFEHVHTFSAN